MVSPGSNVGAAVYLAGTARAFNVMQCGRKHSMMFSSRVYVVKPPWALFYSSDAWKVVFAILGLVLKLGTFSPGEVFRLQSRSPCSST